MKVTDLIREFSTRESLPVDVNDVLATLRKHGYNTEIEFVGVDLDPEILQGTIKVFNIRAGYAEPRRMANIYYHRGHTVDWQRVICCKEVIHLLDPASAYTNDPEEITQLAERIGLPPEMQNPIDDGLAANIDRMAEYRAVALLFPMAARTLLMEPYRNGDITIADIALMTDIPTRYVAFVMHDVWEGVHAFLVNHQD